MSESIRKAFSKLIRSGDMPKTRAEFLDAIETGGDTAKFAFIESLDKLDEKSRAAIGGTMRGGDEPWDRIADAAYGAQKAPESKIRGKKQESQPERIERPGPNRKGDKGTLPDPPAGNAPAAPVQRGAGKSGGKAQGKPVAGAQPAAKRTRGRPAKDTATAAEKQPGALDTVSTPVGTFIPAGQFKGFDAPEPTPAPPQPELGGVTYGQTGLPPADPTGSVDLMYRGPSTFSGDTMGIEPPPSTPSPVPAVDPAKVANPTLAGLLDGGPMEGHFVDDLAPAFGASQDALPGGIPADALTSESLMPQGATFAADTDPSTLRRLNPFDVGRLSDPRFQAPEGLDAPAQQAQFAGDWEGFFANPQPVRPVFDVRRMSESIYPSRPAAKPVPGSFEGVDWNSGLPPASPTVDPSPAGLGYTGGSRGPAAEPGPPKSMAKGFMSSRWPWLIGGAGTIGGLSWAANQDSKQSTAEPVTDETLARQQQRVMQAEQALRAMTSGGGM